MEVFNDSTRRTMFTTCATGSRTHTTTMRLPFDSTSGFHDYRFVFGPGHVRFHVGGVLMREWSDGLPLTSMRLMVNSRFTAWLDGTKPRTDRRLLVGSIRYSR